jgi:hypothetical protein
MSVYLSISPTRHLLDPGHELPMPIFIIPPCCLGEK